MKNWSTLLLLIFLAAGASAQTGGSAATATPPETLQLKESGFDFGKIPQGRPVTHIFEIVNTGSKPLLLDNVQATCGCTTPEWSRAPIKPGATAQIKVGYNAAADGYFTKSITIQYNSNQTKVLTITGNVYRSATTSAPANASLSLLKYQQQ
ncbi:MAG: DUF1573 domain-containing protein [Candidatus Pseudobacter hemicellulosilyticus]|uniref:DUF1573 domain-containing protein n=1 Tax=Candidatus Pseudobacter hemicellulosilyticus TaxID=3121375 RepID=A0AAJ5WVN7_9BACT|nr:MAG: DUF1573 domain-containing protein [Pseudobacter sp.]